MEVMKARNQEDLAAFLELFGVDLKRRAGTCDNGGPILIFPEKFADRALFKRAVSLKIRFILRNPNIAPRIDRDGVVRARLRIKTLRWDGRSLNVILKFECNF